MEKKFMCIYILSRFWRGNKRYTLLCILLRFPLDHSEYTLSGPISNIFKTVLNENLI